MITVIDSNTRDGLHCTAYPSPSALESCAICADKFRMEQMVSHDTGGEYESSDDAKRGTAIHKACAILLRALIDSTVNTGSENTKRVLSTKYIDILSKIAGWDNSYYDLAFKSAQKVYEELLRMERKHGSVTVYIETLVDLGNYLNGYYGTADVVAVAGDDLLVADYKTGYRKISAYENKQLVCYASAFLKGVKHVRLMIVQYSIFHYDTYDVSADGIKYLMAKNIVLIRSVSNGNEHYRCVSDGSCTYCKAKNVCAAYKTSTFGDLINALSTDRDFTDRERAELYMLVNAAENWKKNNRDAIVSSIEAGKCDGYYLQRNKDKVSMDVKKEREILAEIGRDNEDLILAGALDYTPKFDIKAMQDFYGDSFELKFGRFLTKKAGNVVIKRRDDNGHDA